MTQPEPPHWAGEGGASVAPSGGPLGHRVPPRGHPEEGAECGPRQPRHAPQGLPVPEEVTGAATPGPAAPDEGTGPGKGFRSWALRAGDCNYGNPPKHS